MLICTFRPERLLLCLLHTFKEPNTRPGVMIYGRITFFSAIFKTEGHWVYPQSMAEFVDCGLQGKCRLGSIRSAIGSSTHLVGEHLVAAKVVIGTAIGAAKDKTSQEDESGRVGPGIENYSCLHRHQCTIALRT